MSDFLRRGAFSFIILYGSASTILAGNSFASEVVIDRNQKIVLAGRADNPDTGTTDFAVARYNADGSIDTTFNPLGVFGVLQGQVGQVSFDINGTNDGANALVIDRNNKILIAGFTTVTPDESLESQPTTSFAVARLNEDGSLDTTFNAADVPNRFPGNPGTAIIAISPLSDTATGIALDSENRIIITGNTDNGNTQDVAVVRLLESGELDTTFDSGLPTSTIMTVTPGIITIDVQGTNDNVTAVAIDTLNNIYIGGYSDNGLTDDFMVIRLTVDGALDTTYNQFSLTPGIALQGIQDFDSRAFAMKLDRQNNIVIGGFSNTSLITTFALMRFTPDGVLDPTFNPLAQGASQGIVLTSITNSDDQIRGLAIASNNKIVVTGFVNNPTNHSFVTARYNQDGSLDTQTFNPLGAGAIPGVVITNVVPTTDTFINVNNEGHSVALINDNSIVVTGFSNDGEQVNFTTINYLGDGQLNTAGFNATSAQPGRPGIVFTLFGIEPVLQGNGVPLIVGGDVSQIAPDILEDLRYPPVPVPPKFLETGPIITNDSQPTISGSSTANAVITIYLNDIPVNTVIADPRGNWSAQVNPLPDGTYSLVASSVDALTGLSLASIPTELTVATEPPAAPTITVPAVEETIKTMPLSIQGRGIPDTRIELFIDTVPVAQAHVDKNGLWRTLVEKISDGYHSLVAVATDLAGNVSDPSQATTFTIDTGVMKAPRIVSPTSGTHISATTVVVEGDGKVNSRINLFLNDKLVAPVSINNKGQWTYTFKNMKDGDYRIYAQTLDKTLSSEKVNFTVDTIPPRPAIISSTQSPKGLINGNAEPGGRITVYNDGLILGTSVADEKGQWSFTPAHDQKIPRGTHRIKVSVADKAGNISSVVEQAITV